MPAELPDELMEVAASVLDGPSSEWHVRDLSGSYPFNVGKSLYWIIDKQGSGPSALALYDNDKWYILNRPESISKIAELMGQGYGERLLKSDPDALARVLMELYRDPRGYVCTPGFLEAEEPVLFSFLTGTEPDENVLRGLCVEATVTRQDDQWKLTFNAMDRRGGIDRWSVTGTSEPFALTQIDIQPIKPPGTFYFPDEF